MAVGEALKVDAAMMKTLRLGGYLHDLGKISVPDSILLKPGPLDAAELACMRLHPGAGADLVLGLKSLEDVRPIIRHHHERWNGTGYPDGLAGKGIPLGARIIAVVDVYDALHTSGRTSPRVARGGREHPRAGDRSGLLGSHEWSRRSSRYCAVSSPTRSLIAPRRSSASPRRRGTALPDAGFSPAAC